MVPSISTRVNWCVKSDAHMHAHGVFITLIIQLLALIMTYGSVASIIIKYLIVSRSITEAMAISTSHTVMVWRGYVIRGVDLFCLNLRNYDRIAQFHHKQG